MEEKTVYSYSRIECFKQCKRAFWYSYIAKLDRGQNVYSFIGGEMHSILEELQQGNIDRDKALEMFENALIEADMSGYKWMSDNVRDKYVDSIKHYLNNYKPIRCDKFEIEEQFNIDLSGHKITGFIDLYTIKDNIIDIYDYKTSSKFKSNEIYKKFRQMILYGIALEQKYGDRYKINTLNFDMLKYYKVPNKRSKLGYTLKDRCDIDILDFNEYSAAYETMEYTEDIVEETKKYFIDAIEEIESLDGEIEYYPKGLNPEKDFFCKNLCSFCETCKNE